MPTTRTPQSPQVNRMACPAPHNVKHLRHSVVTDSSPSNRFSHTTDTPLRTARWVHCTRIHRRRKAYSGLFDAYRRDDIAENPRSGPRRPHILHAPPHTGRKPPGAQRLPRRRRRLHRLVHTIVGPDRTRPTARRPMSAPWVTGHEKLATRGRPCSLASRRVRLPLQATSQGTFLPISRNALRIG